jgi:hypothetical protein
MPPDDSDPSDPKVSELLAGGAISAAVDEATRKELERWFGLPSFTQLEEKPQRLTAEDDPGIQAVLRQRALATAAVDPNLVASIRERTEERQTHLLRFTPNLEVHVDPDMALFTTYLLDRASTIAEPRELERPEDIEDDLKDRVPQALLRDLHRPASDYEKVFELVDVAAEQRLDIVAEVATAMRASWRLPPLGVSPFSEAHAIIVGIRSVRRESWAALWSEKKLPNRREA